MSYIITRRRVKVSVRGVANQSHRLLRQDESARAAVRITALMAFHTRHHSRGANRPGSTPSHRIMSFPQLKHSYIEKGTKEPIEAGVTRNSKPRYARTQPYTTPEDFQ